MTEKVYNMIEGCTSAILSVGIDYVLNKTIKNVIKPKTIPERIITEIGILGVNMACNYGVYKTVHAIIHPNENKQYEMLVEENIKVIKTCTEVSKVMAEHEIKVENKVDDIYNQIMEGKIDG